MKLLKNHFLSSFIYKIFSNTINLRDVALSIRLEAENCRSLPFAPPKEFVPPAETRCKTATVFFSYI
jgi:hypothetical protein